MLFVVQGQPLPTLRVDSVQVLMVVQIVFTPRLLCRKKGSQAAFLKLAQSTLACRISLRLAS